MSLLLHIGTTVLLYFLLGELGWASGTGFLGAALFAAHPVHVEAVAWIAGVGDVACGFFYCSALWASLRYLKVRRSIWLAVGMVSLLAALFSKEMAVTFPIAALLLFRMKSTELGLNTKQVLQSLVPYVIVLAIYGIARTAALGITMPPAFDDHATIVDWITLSVWMFGRYTQYALAPYPLTGLHLTPLYLQDRLLSTFLFGLLAAILIAALALKRKVVRHGFLWFAMFTVMLAPVFHFKGIAGAFLFAERYLYIPTIPATALLAFCITQLGRKPAIIVATALITAFGGATINHNRHWRNDRTMYSRSVRVYPENVHAWISLGETALNEGDYPLAQRSYEMAERHISDERFVFLNSEYRLRLGLGTLAAHHNSSAEAQVQLRRALELDPSGHEAYTILAAVLSNLERDPEAAIPLLAKAIELDPLDDQARDSMGVALYQLRRFDEAVFYFREALRINPQSELAQQHLETVMQRIGK
jgi:tetratricopeptide (TPR) repeat protein